MYTFLAAIPLLIILVLMLGFRWGGAQAGGAGWLSALVVAVLWFNAGPSVLFWAQVQGIFRAGYVLYIIWGALFFFRATEADGTLKRVSTTLQELAPDPMLQVLLMAWGFTSFLQGVGGFGVPLAVVAPILVTMGFSPLDAVVMPSLGYGWSVSFGSMGASYEALVSASGIEGSLVGPWMAAILGLLCFMGGFAVLGITKRRGAHLPIVGPLLAVLTMGLAMTLVQYAATLIGLQNIAAILGALGGLLVGGLWAFGQRRQLPTNAKIPVEPREVLARMLPYVLLITIIVSVNFIPLLHRPLNHLRLSARIPSLSLRDGTQIPAQHTQSIAVFGHPGAMLVYAAIITLIRAKIRDDLPAGSGERIRKGVLQSGVKSSLGILAMMTMATTMQITGMVTELATAMAALAGQLFPIIAPFIGALGAFMTGSNTNSNVLLGAFQLQVAQTLHLHVPLILALQNAGAAIGSIFAPAKVIVGCSTVGLSGAESDVLGRTVRFGLVVLMVLAGLGFVVAHFAI